MYFGGEQHFGTDDEQKLSLLYKENFKFDFSSFEKNSTNEFFEKVCLHKIQHFTQNLYTKN